MGDCPDVGGPVALESRFPPQGQAQVSVDNDPPVGPIFSRREVLASFGITGAALLAGRPGRESADPPIWPICVVRPAQEEGPYFVDEKLSRRDIRSDPATGVVSIGTPLLLSFRVSRLLRGRCVPLVGATVDIWHCDALGIYSDVQDQHGRFDSRGRKFLRGFQSTNTSGVVRFTTIYPGWEDGRAVHVHFKIRTTAGRESHHDFTSQAYFNDTLSDRVHARLPYSARGRGRVPNSADDIFRDQQGNNLVLTTTRRGGGYSALLDLALTSA